VPNPNQPTISVGAKGDAVKRLQRALRRMPDLGIAVDGNFTPSLQAVVKSFQSDNGLTADGAVGPQTWAALPDGRPMPVLHQGSTGAVVKSLQQLLTNGAQGEWNVTPGAIDGDFGPKTKASVEAFQKWGEVKVDGIVGDQTWSVSLHAASSTLETAVGLQFVVGT
jgi:peptidoglycan hydrolase-like protein with peptidoglycan-binding domain